MKRMICIIAILVMLASLTACDGVSIQINIGGKELSIGVIGPKRMNYSKVIGMINQLATGLDRMFGEDKLLGDGESKY